MQRFPWYCCQKQQLCMKRLLIFITIWSFTHISCNKSIPSVCFSEKITGKWRYTESYYSIGGPLIYVSTESAGQWIIFNADGSFKSNIPHFINISSYKILDSSRVKFIAPTQQPGYRLFYLSLDPVDNSLTLSPADFVCKEGCGDKFKR
jgi:hypothetical protein